MTTKTKTQPERAAACGAARHAVRGLYALTPDTSDTTELQRRVSEAIAGGARIVQYRNKTAPATLRRQQADLLSVLCRNSGVPLIINDDIELACAVGADGVHLGREDAPLAAARAVLGTRALVGISCYDDLARALEAERAGASYVALGSFFPSAVKPGAVRASLALLRRARAALGVPIVAIGGITADNAPQLIAAGADALAVISALFNVPDSYAAAQAFAPAFSALRPSPGSSMP
jgi:thiamine-phosphate pyrophosphorylase